MLTCNDCGHPYNIGDNKKYSALCPKCNGMPRSRASSTYEEAVHKELVELNSNLRLLIEKQDLLLYTLDTYFYELKNR